LQGEVRGGGASGAGIQLGRPKVKHNKYIMSSQAAHTHAHTHTHTDITMNTQIQMHTDTNAHRISGNVREASQN